jgi:hypothetical protein
MYTVTVFIPKRLSSFVAWSNKENNAMLHLDTSRWQQNESILQNLDFFCILQIFKQKVPLQSMCALSSHEKISRLQARVMPEKIEEQNRRHIQGNSYTSIPLPKDMALSTSLSMLQQQKDSEVCHCLEVGMKSDNLVSTSRWHESNQASLCNVTGCSLAC